MSNIQTLFQRIHQRSTGTGTKKPGTFPGTFPRESGGNREPKFFKKSGTGGNREPKILKNRERAGTGNRLNDIRLNGQTDRITKFSSTFRPTEHNSAKLSGQRDSRRRNWIRKCVNFNSLNSHIK